TASRARTASSLDIGGLADSVPRGAETLKSQVSSLKSQVHHLKLHLRLETRDFTLEIHEAAHILDSSSAEPPPRRNIGRPCSGWPWVSSIRSLTGSPATSGGTIPLP